MESSRRKFIRDSALAIGGICCGTVLLNGCSPFVYAEHTVEENRVVVSKVGFGENNHVIIKMDNLKKPVYIGKLDDGNYSALLMECTHKRCTVRPAGNILHCPCHGSEYSNTGKVLESPAEKDLPAFRVSHDENNIYIY